MTETASSNSNGDSLSYNSLARAQNFDDLAHGHEILSVTDKQGKDLDYTIVDTMMRIDLPAPLKPNQSNTFSIAWAFNIINNERIGGGTVSNTLGTTTPISTFLLSGSPDSSLTQIMLAGSISSFWGEASSHSNSATTTFPLLSPRTISYLQQENCKTHPAFFPASSGNE